MDIFVAVINKCEKTFCLFKRCYLAFFYSIMLKVSKEVNLTTSKCCQVSGIAGNNGDGSFERYEFLKNLFNRHYF